MSGSSDTEPSITDLIKDYYAKKPDFSQYFGKKSQNEPPADRLQSLGLDDEKPENLRPAKRYKLKLKRDNMPHHPAEENATGNITDQVAKDSSDSTASTHPHHQEDTGATSGGSVGAMAHKANPGPVVAENIGEPASKEELKKRAEELNK